MFACCRRPWVELLLVLYPRRFGNDSFQSHHYIAQESSPSYSEWAASDYWVLKRSRSKFSPCPRRVMCSWLTTPGKFNKWHIGRVPTYFGTALYSIEKMNIVDRMGSSNFGRRGFSPAITTFHLRRPVSSRIGTPRSFAIQYTDTSFLADFEYSL